jgi:hypothetical protein
MIKTKSDCIDRGTPAFALRGFGAPGGSRRSPSILLRAMGCRMGLKGKN